MISHRKWKHSSTVFESIIVGNLTLTLHLSTGYSQLIWYWFLLKMYICSNYRPSVSLIMNKRIGISTQQTISVDPHLKIIQKWHLFLTKIWHILTDKMMKQKMMQCSLLKAHFLILSDNVGLFLHSSPASCSFNQVLYKTNRLHKWFDFLFIAKKLSHLFIS